MYEFDGTCRSLVVQLFVSVAEADSGLHRSWHCQHEAPRILQKLIVSGQHPSLEQCFWVWHHCSDSSFLILFFPSDHFCFGVFSGHILDERMNLKMWLPDRSDPACEDVYRNIRNVLHELLLLSFCACCMCVPCWRLRLSAAMSSREHVIRSWPSVKTGCVLAAGSGGDRE